MTRWNPADRTAALEGAKSFFAVMDSDGVMIDQDADAEEAWERAAFASPTGTVVVDSTVYADDDLSPEQNPPTGALARAPQVALAASKIPTGRIGIDWESFDPGSPAGRSTVREARERLRDRGTELYDELLELAAKEVHVKQKRGGVAAEFHPDWLTGDLLRENQKMKKVLGLGDGEYDSIGLSLLPHGASFRPPFSTSTEQGSRGATNCLFSTPECRKVCLVNTGQRALESGSFAASYLFSHLLRDLPEEFLANLFERCVLAFEQAGTKKGGYRFIRLNVLSDLPWEIIAPGFLEAVCDRARGRMLGHRPWGWDKGLAFYDYTKIPYRPGIPDAYDITFSFGGQRSLYPAFFDVLEGKRGSAKRAAVVFVRRENDVVRSTGVPYRAAPGLSLISKTNLHQPFTFMGLPVWNGDRTDIRALDPDEVKIVGLAYKVARYKVEAKRGALTSKGKLKKFELVNVVPTAELDAQLPTFIVRVKQPDPDAPPIVMATQDLDNRKLVFDDLSE